MLDVGQYEQAQAFLEQALAMRWRLGLPQNLWVNLASRRGHGWIF
jgi:hypothetical protein